MSEQEKMLHGKSEKLRLGQWLLLLYVAVAFVLVLAALAVHTLTQSGGIVQIYLFLPAAAGLSAVLIGGGILFFGEGVKAVRSPGLAHIRHLPRGFSVVCYLACGAAALAFGVFFADHNSGGASGGYCLFKPPGNCGIIPGGAGTGQLERCHQRVYEGHSR